MMIFGIDPGMNGGIALRDENGGIYTWIMPIIEKGLDAKAIKNILCTGDMVVMEKVSAMPGQGVTGMFHFGVGYRMIQGIVITLGIPLRLVTPQAWKKEILAGTTKDKAAAIEYVMRVFPNVNLIPVGKRKPQDGLAESACIAEYGYRIYGK